MTPGERYTVTLRLNALGSALPLGTRLRLALAPAYWPHAWPSPELVTLTVFTGGASALTLPERPPRLDDASLPPFEAPEAAPPLEVKLLRTGGVELTKQADASSGELRITLRGDQGRHLLVASGIEYESYSTTTWQVSEGQPLSASVLCAQTIGIAQGAMRTRVETLSTLSADAEQFYVTNTLDAFEGETRVFAKAWDFSVARDLV